MTNQQVLTLIHDIGVAEHVDGELMTTADLLIGRSERTLRRETEAARAIGADLVSVRTPEGHYAWRCANFEEIEDELRLMLRFTRDGFSFNDAKTRT